MMLIDFLRKDSKINSESLRLIDSAFYKIEKKKGFKLIQTGDKAKKLFFMEKGLARIHYDNEEKDITQGFFSENSFTLSVVNINLEEPSPHTITLLEPSIIRSINLEELGSLMIAIPPMQEVIRTALIEGLEAMNERLSSLQFTSAQDRYHYFLKTHPELVLRIPLGYIASYLGITQQTLSVIRAKK